MTLICGGTAQEIATYSIFHDCTVARISMANDRCQELFMLVQQRNPKHRRAERCAACEAIQEAIDAGLPAGEVRVTPDVWRDMVAQQIARQAQERAA